MNTNVLSVQEIREITDTSILPNGEYKGVWGGYRVLVKIDGVQYTLQTENGIRTPAAPCTVRIQDGNITVETP